MFEAARRIPTYPTTHPASNLHGHSFGATIKRLNVESSQFDIPSLERQLRFIIKELDYSYLNDHISNPSDENIANWLQTRLIELGNPSVAIQSTSMQGVEMSARKKTVLWRLYHFNAAHRLPHVPESHKCGRMHGHSFGVAFHVDVKGINQHGLSGYDFLDRAWKPIGDVLNFNCLNEVAGLENPTSEMISKWIFEQMSEEVNQLLRVTVYETPTVGAFYDGKEFGIWKEVTFDSATQHRSPLADQVRKNLHGFTYSLRLFFAAPLDQLLGWTIDYGDIKAVFQPVYELIDHQPLFQNTSLADGDTLSIAQWIKEQAIELLPSLSRVELYEKKNCGVILDWQNKYIL